MIINIQSVKVVLLDSTLALFAWKIMIIGKKALYIYNDCSITKVNGFKVTYGYG
jgi:hypothetical protein